MLLFLATLVTASHLAGPDASLLGGTHGADLIPSYMAGCFVREGRPDKLMNFAEAARFQAHLRRVWRLEQNGRTGPWLNPPYYAWVFVPLSALPYPAAQAVWLGCNLLTAAGAISLLVRMCKSPLPLITRTGAWSPGGAKECSPGREPGGTGLALSSLSLLPCFSAPEGRKNNRPAPDTGTTSFFRPSGAEEEGETQDGEGVPFPQGSRPGLHSFAPPGLDGAPSAAPVLDAAPPAAHSLVRPTAIWCGAGRARGVGRPHDWRTWGLIPLLMATSMPFIQAMASQQNTFLSLFLLTAVVWFWRRGQGLRAGLVAGLLLFKPQLAAVVAAALCCSLGRRAALGLLVSASVLLLSTALAMPGALGDYIDKLPALLPWLKTGSHYAWERQVTFQGFWRLLIQGPVTGPAPAAVRLLWPTCALAVAARLLPAFARAWKATGNRAEPPDRFIAATVAATPLLMPYYMDYDLLLLAVPAVLFAAERCATLEPLDRVDRLVLAGWVVLFPLLFLNAAFAEATRVSLTVPLLAGMAGLYALRAARPAVAGASEWVVGSRDRALRPAA